MSLACISLSIAAKTWPHSFSKSILLLRAMSHSRLLELNPCRIILFAASITSEHSSANIANLSSSPELNYYSVSYTLYSDSLGEIQPNSLDLFLANFFTCFNN